MAFIVEGSLRPWGAPVLRREILTGSATYTVEDSLKLVSGFATLNTAGISVFGHVCMLGTNQGVGLNTNGIAGAAIGSFIDTFATASDNTTVAKVRADVDISIETMRSEVCSAAIGTTTGSNLLGYYLDLTDEDTLDEGSAVTTTAQYFNWGVNPSVATRINVTIAESRVFNIN